MKIFEIATYKKKSMLSEAKARKLTESKIPDLKA